MVFASRLLLIVLALTVYSSLPAQVPADAIQLRNPSFEDLPRNSEVPIGWNDCGAPLETPPDIHPDPEDLFNVIGKASDGKTFLGMVTRDNQTTESIGQQLTAPFIANQCYQFDIELSRSRSYMSMSRVNNKPANYNTPIRLRVWGGYANCDRGQLLGETGVVANFDWAPYRIKLTPEADFTHIILEAYYPKAILLPVNGNLLLDNAHALRPIDCEEPLQAFAYEVTEPEAIEPEADIQTTPVPAPRTQPRSIRPSAPAIAEAPKTEEPTVRLGNTEAILRAGSVFAVENISFKTNSAELEEESENALQEIVGFLRENANVIVEIGGHASRMAGDFYATDLSQDRASAVVSYLKSHSIGFERLLPKGYGKSKPVCREATKECNRRNQRVEVKILKIKES